jgi:hypothetical protein
LRVHSLIQDIQENAELEQIQLEDWEDEASKDEVTEDAKLAIVQQEIERLYQEQEVITWRQPHQQRKSKARKSSSTTPRSFVNRNRGKNLRLIYYTTKTTPIPPLCHTSKSHTLNTLSTTLRKPPLASAAIWHHRCRKPVGNTDPRKF